MYCVVWAGIIWVSSRIDTSQIDVHTLSNHTIHVHLLGLTIINRSQPTWPDITFSLLRCIPIRHRSKQLYSGAGYFTIILQVLFIQLHLLIKLTKCNTECVQWNIIMIFYTEPAALSIKSHTCISSGNQGPIFLFSFNLSWCSLLYQSLINHP